MSFSNVFCRTPAFLPNDKRSATNANAPTVRCHAIRYLWTFQYIVFYQIPTKTRVQVNAALSNFIDSYAEYVTLKQLAVPTITMYLSQILPFPSTVLGKTMGFQLQCAAPEVKC